MKTDGVFISVPYTIWSLSGIWEPIIVKQSSRSRLKQVLLPPALKDSIYMR